MGVFMVSYDLIKAKDYDKMDKTIEAAFKYRARGSCRNGLCNLTRTPQRFLTQWHQPPTMTTAFSSPNAHTGWYGTTPALRTR
jgi:hypothetical protein